MVYSFTFRFSSSFLPLEALPRPAETGSFDSIKILIIFWPPCDIISSTTPSCAERIACPFGGLASKTSSTLGKPCVISPAPATPPIWNVLIVSWVPGSPIAWAVTIPAASPIFMREFVPKSFPKHIEQIPFVLLHLKTDLTRNSLSSMLSIFSDCSRFIIEPFLIAVFPSSSLSSSKATLPKTRSPKARPISSPSSLCFTIPTVSPQSSILITTSCATSTRRRVK